MNLVLQSPTLQRREVDAVAEATKPASIEQIRRGAYRLRDAQQHASVAAFCQSHRIDYAWRHAGRRFADLGLLAMDMDSTLITIECVDELGALTGKHREIQSVTNAAMSGEIADYRESLRSRVAWLAGLDVSSLETVYREKVRLSQGAEELMEACKQHGVKTLLASSGFTFFTERLRARLGFDYTISNALEVVDGCLTGRLLGEIVDADDKARKFASVLRELEIPTQLSVAVGDGANDLKMMAVAGLSIAFHAKPLVLAKADCALTYCGLDGVLNLFE